MNLDGIRAAVAKAQRVLAQTQKADGSWNWPNDIGAFISAQALVALKFVGRLSAEDARDGARYLASQQLPDGSFGGVPFATGGDLGATASAWAGFHACGLADHDQPLASARAWVEAHGGVAAVIARLGSGDLASLFLAMEKLVEPAAIPAPPLLLTLLPPIEKLLEKKFNTGIVMMLSECGALLRHLRGDWGEHGDQRGWFASLECRRVLELLDQYQNPNGSWNSNVVQQAISLPALVALGVDDDRLTRAVDWLLAQRVRDADGLWFVSFDSTIWTTALALRALLSSGVPRDDPRVTRALEYLISAQIKEPMPGPSQPKDGVPRSGGWAFGGGDNITMPDCDDTGVVLGALGMALAGGGLSPELAERVRQASAAGRDWLFGMQNQDGGWGSYQAGMPGKPRGAIMDKPLDLPMSDRLAMAKLFLDPPVELGDPSAEDATGRIVYGLGRLGFTRTAPEVAQALTFLGKQQLDHGGWWGRWMVNYNAATACVLGGCASVGVDSQSELVRHGVRFLTAHQNGDGGWGEDSASYSDPARAGVGPSNPPLTGMVVTALLAVGEGGSEAVVRGVKYLGESQRSDGTWSNGDWLHAYLPPLNFYYLPGEPRHYPLEALGLYLAYLGAQLAVPAGQTPAEEPELSPRLTSGDWNPDFLESMRQAGDPLADAVIDQIFAEGDLQAVGKIFAQITRSDEPIPPGLPQPALDYFEATSALPPWADQEQIAAAEQLWIRVGWAAATSLFCGALPQAYAARNGARVLVGTGGMTVHIERRVFETAQFLFDVLDRGALGPGGRGVRSAQKVRLLHSAIRHLTLKEPSWSLAWGVPINQEDLGGTLMSFSCVILDALRALRVSFSSDEGEAFLHTWKIVGHFMGVDARLLPRDRADGEALMEYIRRTQWQASPEGASLAAALVKMMQKYLPGRSFNGLPVTLMRDLAGDHCADLLSLPRADWTRRVVHTATEIDAWLGLDRHSLGATLMAEASHRLMKGLVDAFRDGKQTTFRIPDALVHAWNLKD